MKIALISAAAAVTAATSASAFVPTSSARTASLIRSSSVAVVDGDSSATVASDDDDVSIYDKIGFAKDNVAMGIDAEEVFDYLGGREELITKFQKDCPHFDTARASLEVDKFMMDAEMVNAVIAYQKRRRKAIAAGSDLPSEPAKLDPVQEYGTYALFIGGGVGIAEAKSAFIDHAENFPFENFIHSFTDKAEVVAGVADTVVDPSAVQMTLEGTAAALN
jgi:hypothetical protein